MKKLIFILHYTFCTFILCAQHNPELVSTIQNIDTLPKMTDTLKIYPNNIQIDAFPTFKLRYQDDSFGKKLVRSIAVSSVYDLAIIGVLLLAPESISKWENREMLKPERIRERYKLAYTTLPIIDHDMFITNYIGHPYQGAFYFNQMRSQGATFMQSSLYNLSQSLLWEYVWEAGLEQPSIQDLLVTPIAGTIAGELINKSTLKMRKNGFRWYEKVFVIIFNPNYAINNGFRTLPSE